MNYACIGGRVGHMKRVEDRLYVRVVTTDFVGGSTKDTWHTVSSMGKGADAIEKAVQVGDDVDFQCNIAYSQKGDVLTTHLNMDSFHLRSRPKKTAPVDQ